MRLHEAVSRFPEACRTEQKLSEKTVRAYSYDLAQFADFVTDKEFRIVEAEDIKSYLDYLENEQSLKNSTIRRKVMTLKAFFGYHVDRGDLAANPLNGLELRFGSQKTQPRVLNVNDVLRLLDYVEEDVKNHCQRLRPGVGKRARLLCENAIRDRAIVELLFATAMRIGELTDLDVEDVDLEMGVIHVKGKGNRDRYLAIASDKTLDALRAYWEIRSERANGAAAFFLNRFGGRMSIFAVENMFERVRKASGIRRRVTPHALRHTMASMLRNNGVAVERVRDILGHSSIVTTQIYDDIAPRRQKRLLEQLNDDQRLTVELAQISPADEEASTVS